MYLMGEHMHLSTSTLNLVPGVTPFLKVIFLELRDSNTMMRDSNQDHLDSHPGKRDSSMDNESFDLLVL